MTQSRIIPPVFLIQRGQIEEILRHQVWADAQMRRQLQEMKQCVEMTSLGSMTPAGARARLVKIARAMNAATLELARVSQSVLKSARHAEAIHAGNAAPGLRGLPAQSLSSWRDWQWQGTNPAAGCLTFEAADWNDLFAVIDLWVERAIQRALAVRATAEYLVVRLDGTERARSMTEELFKQLDYSAQEFWSNFALTGCIGVSQLPSQPLS
jgi:hypothetical protein